MTSSLVGSEMCIRDRWKACPTRLQKRSTGRALYRRSYGGPDRVVRNGACLLYTSDAADDM
eukprot:11068317-Prorocentrum_lima.AAC.1